MRRAMEAFTSRVLDVAHTAEDIFHINLTGLIIESTVRGRKAAIAGLLDDHYPYISCNSEAVEQYTDDMCRLIAPHEVAHIVCALAPIFGCGHDAGWKATCVRLGGDGMTYHNFDLSPAKVMYTYMYETDAGSHIELGQNRHSRLQTGRTNWYKSLYLGKVYACGFKHRITHLPSR